MKVELLYFDGCPGYEDLRPHLEHLLDERGGVEQLTVVPINSPEEAAAHRFLGSPSVRVDGRDVEPAAATRSDYGIQCRIYQTTDGLVRTPPSELRVAALDHKSG